MLNCFELLRTETAKRRSVCFAYLAVSHQAPGRSTKEREAMKHGRSKVSGSDCRLLLVSYVGKVGRRGTREALSATLRLVRISLGMPPLVLNNSRHFPRGAWMLC